MNDETGQYPGPGEDDHLAVAPTVFEAWSNVMEEVQSISKDSRNKAQGFNFRGIDTVMNVVGPLLRKHRVVVVPGAVEESAERYETKDKGTAMVNRVVHVDFQVYGPRGDSFIGSAFGEAADSGDKAMAKAHSVAYRTFLLQALTIPTDEPDPDASSHDRSAPRRENRPLDDSNADGRNRLTALCEEKGWDKLVVANLFAGQKEGQSLKTADNATIDGFRLLLEKGLLTVPGAEPESPAADVE